jgi:hypothetical protein
MFINCLQRFASQKRAELRGRRLKKEAQKIESLKNACSEVPATALGSVIFIIYCCQLRR